ncbi:MAG TPA: FRG domain-containing protein [Planctomycetota bacterium]|nr:FRG domain-containing protein [Planctomycetota bacterium]
MNSDFLSFVDEVDRKRKEISCSRSGAFFRGHARADYRLVPSLLRRPLHPDTEHNLFHECYARAGHLMTRESNSWERLAYFQHYGIPSRLLDWTDSLGMALFFALRGRVEAPHVWIVNAFRLNKSNGAAKRPRILMPGLDVMPDYHDCFIRVEALTPWPYDKPVFLQIPWTTERVRAQSGFFTFHASEDPMDELCPKYLRQVPVPTAAFDGAERFLASP